MPSFRFPILKKLKIFSKKKLKYKLVLKEFWPLPKNY